MRVSVGPTVDEGGFGYSMNFIQAKSMRDAAAMLDCLSIPMTGDPFIIPKPNRSYAELSKRTPKKLRVGMVVCTENLIRVDDVMESLKLAE